MKNKILLLLISTFLFIGCGNNKNVDPALAGTITDPPAVKVAPADMSLTVINNTGHDLVGAQTWCMTGACDTPIPNGAKVKLESNMVDANTITIKMYPPADIDQPNPTTGIFQMNYQYWSGMAHVVCDNEWVDHQTKPVCVLNSRYVKQQPSFCKSFNPDSLIS